MAHFLSLAHICIAHTLDPWTPHQTARFLSLGLDPCSLARTFSLFTFTHTPACMHSSLSTQRRLGYLPLPLLLRHLLATYSQRSNSPSRWDLQIYAHQLQVIDHLFIQRDAPAPFHFPFRRVFVLGNLSLVFRSPAFRLPLD